MNSYFSKTSTTLELLHMQISRQHMYDDKDPLVNKILHEMAYSPIERVSELSKCYLFLKHYNPN